MRTRNFDFRVRLGNGGNTKEYNHAGLTYIEGRKGSDYSIYYKNLTNQDQLAVFSVDGLSIMDGKPAGPSSNGYVIPPYGEVTIPGWRIDDTKVAAFKFSPQSDHDQTYVEQLAAEGFNVSTENQGNIGVMVFNRKVVHQYPPYYLTNYIYLNTKPIYPEGLRYNDLYPTSYTVGASGTSIPTGSIRCSSALQGQGQNSIGASFSSTLTGSANLMATEQSLGTGFGEDKSFKTNTTTFERTDTPLEVAVIVYDTLTGLKKRGVVVNQTGVSAAFPEYQPNGCYVPKNR